MLFFVQVVEKKWGKIGHNAEISGIGLTEGWGMV